MNDIGPKEGWGSLEAAEKHALPSQFIIAVQTIDAPPGSIYYNIVKRTKQKHCWGTEPSVEEMVRHNAQYESKPIYFIADDETFDAARHIGAIRKKLVCHVKSWTARKPISRSL